MLRLRLIAIVLLGSLLSGCMSDGTSLDTSVGGGLGAIGNSVALPGINLGALGSSSGPGTDAYVKQELARRGI